MAKLLTKNSTNPDKNQKNKFNISSALLLAPLLSIVIFSAIPFEPNAFIKKAIEYFDKLKIQLPLGFDGYHCGETPLMAAVWWDGIDVVNVILDKTSELEARKALK